MIGIMPYTVWEPGEHKTFRFDVPDVSEGDMIHAVRLEPTDPGDGPIGQYLLATAKVTRGSNHEDGGDAPGEVEVEVHNATMEFGASFGPARVYIDREGIL